MPYVNRDVRNRLDEVLTPLLVRLRGMSNEGLDGAVNYCVTKTIRDLYSGSYYSLNRAVGVLESVKQEYYRRVVAPYEDVKRMENGDI
jgi:hypothetical protein